MQKLTFIWENSWGKLLFCIDILSTFAISLENDITRACRRHHESPRTRAREPIDGTKTGGRGNTIDQLLLAEFTASTLVQFTTEALLHEIVQAVAEGFELHVVDDFVDEGILKEHFGLL